MNLKDKILQCDDCTKVKVHVPEWDCDVYVRSLTAYEAEQVTQSKGDHNALLAVYSVVDEDGNNIFSKADLPALRKKSSVALQRLVEPSLKLNRLEKDAVDDYEKN